MAAFGLLVARPEPILSQAVQLAKVDVSVVAKGYRASKLTGTTVMNDKNETIGKLDDVIISPDNRAMFAVLQVGSFLGIGGRLVAFPYENLVINEADGKFVLPGADAR
jgi:sporulation protein YlmC with PRC-barrel domain